MSSGNWNNALCLTLLAVIVIDIGYIVRADSLSEEAYVTLAGTTAVAGLVPVLFAAYLVHATRGPK